MFSGVASIGGRDFSRGATLAPRTSTFRTPTADDADDKFYQDLEKEWTGDWLDYYGHKADFDAASRELADLAEQRRVALQAGDRLERGPQTLKDLLDAQIRRRRSAADLDLRRLGGEQSVSVDGPPHLGVQRLQTISRPSTAATAHEWSADRQPSLDATREGRLVDESRDEPVNAVRVRRSVDASVATDPAVLNRHAAAKKLGSDDVVDCC